MGQSPLSYHHNYNRVHRQELNRKARDRYKAAMPKEDICQADLTADYEQKQGIRKYVVCRFEDCHVRRGRLPWHLRIFHKVTESAYHRRFPGAPLECTDLLESKITVRRSKKGTFHYHTWRGKPRIEWLVVCGVVSGKSAPDIGRAVGRGQNTVRIIARKHGLHGPRCYYHLGNLVTNGYAANLQKSLGLDDVRSFEQLCGLNARTLQISRPKSASHASHLVGRHAPAVIQTIDRVIREIYMVASRPGQRRLNAARFLSSVVPNLSALGTSMREVFAQSRNYLREHRERGLGHWQSWLCERALSEKESGTSGPFRRFLPFAPKVSKFIEPKFASLRARKGGDLWTIASEMLAACLGVSESVARMAQLVRPLGSDEIRLILSKNPQVWQAESSAPAASRAETGRRRGRPGPDPTPVELTAWHRIGLEVERTERDLISAGLPPKTALEAARTKVADLHLKTSRRTIALYHRHFLRWEKKNPPTF